MFFDEFLEKANQLTTNNEPFAVAVVVRYTPPISGKPGDKAIIDADGRILGWIGGGCSQPIVVKEAKLALEDGKPRLVRVSPDGGSEVETGITGYDMNCHSGGSLDIYIEPVLPKPQLVIIGRSVVAQTLAKLAKILNYQIIVVADDVDAENFPDVDAIHPLSGLSEIQITRQTYVVISTQGESDEEALAAALSLDAAYVAFVASRRKSEAVFRDLEAQGISAEKLAQIRVPAGLNINAKSSEEIAVSILAEVISVRRSEAKMASNHPTIREPETAAPEAKDPICGMSVDIDSAKYTSDYQGQTFYFCCAGCKQKFDKTPGMYVQET
jgi:xanthine dehydrogenase accessory factor